MYLEGSWKGTVESKLHLEASWEGPVESKWRLEASLQGQVPYGGQLEEPSGVQVALRAQQQGMKTYQIPSVSDCCRPDLQDFQFFV